MPKAKPAAAEPQFNPDAIDPIAVEPAPLEVAPVVLAEPAEPEPAPVIEAELPETTVMIELPTRLVPDSHYRSRFIHIPGMTIDQANAAKALFEGLHKQQARLKNGRYVKNLPDAIRFVLEQIAAELPTVAPIAKIPSAM